MKASASGQPSAVSRQEGFPEGWHAALSEAWTAYLHGSYPIGAAIVDGAGEVIARGRNRLGEGRAVDGVISGHRLGHAEVNTLLTLPELTAEESRQLTLVTTVEPCPMCLGAMLMARIGRLAFAASDPWGGHTDALTDTFYPRQKNVQVSRAPEEVERMCTVLLLTFFLDHSMPREHGFFVSHQEQHPHLFEAALQLHASGALAALRTRQAPLSEALSLLNGEQA
ncbi:nucleoside deaminase [Deinococcus sp. MIMF12]|uniref:Nucleoside deaminase n=1 Tax=Deinococcus rhizophilus TaxID=3049544 RepID=A0ABT7JCE4_9DEIO|nr:nucleoside deaminase [Deinococcus rhizophilus]MDL2342718.1 nucleoside deaminase [Deinococcus rhizophilus]